MLRLYAELFGDFGLDLPTLHLVVFFVLTKVGICMVSMALVSSVDVNVGESTHTI